VGQVVVPHVVVTVEPSSPPADVSVDPSLLSFELDEEQLEGAARRAKGPQAERRRAESRNGKRR
jgi:hypothetical protein